MAKGGHSIKTVTPSRKNKTDVPEARKCLKSMNYQTEEKSQKPEFGSGLVQHVSPHLFGFYYYHHSNEPYFKK